MQTFKKKNIRDFEALLEDNCKECEVVEEEVVEEEVVEEDMIEEEETIDELVTATGGSISGDDPNVNNSEIKTAPQNTTDQFNAMAIQPNRYLYGVTGSAYSAGARQGTMESVDKIAQDKFINLLENNMDVDIDNNGVPDTETLRQDTVNKVNALINTLGKNGIEGEQLMVILNQLLDAFLPLLDETQLQMIKDKLNA
jgi:hypothetical protein